MGYSKKSFMEFQDRDLEQYRESQYDSHMADLDEIPTTWLAQREMDEWQLTIEQHENIVCELVDKAEEGSELESYCTLKELRKILDDAIKQIEPLAMDKCELHSPNNTPFTNANFEIQKRNGGRSIDFSNVPEVSVKETELKTLKEKLKHAFMGLENGATMLSGEQMVLSDGELINKPSWKYRKDSITTKKL
jgi:hypothetical protein